VLPGKKYMPEDVLRMAWRRKWVISVSFALIATTTFAVSRALPNRYRSDEVIEVVPQRVSQTYVRPTVTTRIEDRLGAIQQRVTSRTWLERVITEFNLYPKMRGRVPMEDIIERMRSRDIEVVVIRGDAFRLSFLSEDRHTAMKVTERLASLVINESLLDRSGYADSTTEFLQSQLESAGRQLADQDQKVAAYQRSHAGELPSERQSNLTVLHNLQMQVQAVVESINRDSERVQILDRLIADATLEAQMYSGPAPASAQAARASEGGGTISEAPLLEQLEDARTTLRTLQLRLKPDHPDIKRWTRVLADLEAKVKAESQKPAVATPDTARASSPDAVARRNRIKELETEKASLKLQLAGREAAEQRLRRDIQECERRLNATPLREAEMISLTRDYDTQRKNYEGLLARYEEAKVAANLEHREIGEQFKVLDPARLPETPISPNRPFINMAGALAGLGLGLGLAFILEYRDRSMHTEDDALLCLSLPVLAMVPVITTKAERRLARQRRIMTSLAATAGVVLVAAGAAAWKLGWFATLMGR
jgi:polysaccharide chain length determinant protein (PEP-CTERM system associated)